MSETATSSSSVSAGLAVIDLREEVSRTRLFVRGEVDIASAPRLHERLSRAIEIEELDRQEVLIDLTDVTFIDSSGLGVLVNARQRAKARGVRLELVLPVGPARFPFEVTGLAELFDRYRSASSDSDSD